MITGGCGFFWGELVSSLFLGFVYSFVSKCEFCLIEIVVGAVASAAAAIDIM